MLKKSLFFSAIFLVALSAHPLCAMAGFTGPGPGVITVEQVQSLSDDANIVLQGNIEKSLGGEDYLFKDHTGTITVEIDAVVWGGLSVGPADKVEISGEVDKDWFSVKAEVKSIRKL